MENMVWETVGRGPKAVNGEMYISVRKSSLMLNRVFYDKAEIEKRKYKFVQVRRNNPNHCLLLEFITQQGLDRLHAHNGLVDGIYELQRDGGPKSTYEPKRNSIINCGTVIRRTPWLKAVAAQATVISRRYVPEQGSSFNLWIVRFMPGFAHEMDASDCNVPADAKGIYCYVGANEEILYIGQGNIKQRFDLHAKQKEIPATLFRWTPVADKQARIRAEAHHIDAFMARYGRLPTYNLVRGHKLAEPQTLTCNQ